MLANFKPRNVTIGFFIGFSILVLFKKDEILDDDELEALKEDWQNCCNIFCLRFLKNNYSINMN